MEGQRGHNAEPRITKVHVTEHAVHTLNNTFDVDGQPSPRPGVTCPLFNLPSNVIGSAAGNRMGRNYSGRTADQLSIQTCFVAECSERACMSENSKMSS